MRVLVAILAQPNRITRLQFTFGLATIGDYRKQAMLYRTGFQEGEVDFNELPDMLTVEEMAKAFRLGRSQAYELTKRYRLTGGKEGIPVLQLGRQLRIPKEALLKLVHNLPSPDNLP